MSSVFDVIEPELEPYARELEDFEAGATRPGTPAGARRDWHVFHRKTCAFFTALADALQKELSRPTVRLRSDFSFKIVSREKKCWTRIQYRKRICYLPRIVHPDASRQAEMALSWLSCRIPQEQIEKGLRETPTWHGLGTERVQGAKNRYFSFQHCVGLADTLQQKRKIFLECITGKSSDRCNLDGNAHQRVAYKMLQYLEMTQNSDTPSELAVLGNGAFLKYSSVFYPSIQMHRRRLISTFQGFQMAMCFERAHFLELARRIVHWTVPPPPIGVIRRRPRGAAK